MYEAEGRWEQAHTLASSQSSEHALACSLRHALIHSCDLPRDLAVQVKSCEL